LVGSGDGFLKPGDHFGADLRVAFGLGGVEADDPPVTVTEFDFFDLQVVAHGGVAALSRQRLGGFGRA
jgi:hypothetical protein